MILILLLFAYDVPSPPLCIIDRCEQSICIVETPEGTVNIQKKPYYEEGMPIACPFWLIDPT